MGTTGLRRSVDVDVDVDARLREKIGEHRYKLMVRKLQAAIEAMNTIQQELPEFFASESGLPQEAHDALEQFIAALKTPELPTVKSGAVVAIAAHRMRRAPKGISNKARGGRR